MPTASRYLEISSVTVSSRVKNKSTLKPFGYPASVSNFFCHSRVIRVFHYIFFASEMERSDYRIDRLLTSTKDLPDYSLSVNGVIHGSPDAASAA